MSVLRSTTSSTNSSPRTTRTPGNTPSSRSTAPRRVRPGTVLDRDPPPAPVPGPWPRRGPGRHRPHAFASRTTSRRTSSDSGTRLCQLLRMSNVKEQTPNASHNSLQCWRPPIRKVRTRRLHGHFEEAIKKPGSVVKKDTEIGRVKRRVIQTPPPDTQVKLVSVATST